MGIIYGSYTINHKGTIDDINELCTFNEYFLTSVKYRLNLIDNKLISKLDNNIVSVKFLFDGKDLNEIRDKINTIITDRKQKSLSIELLNLDHVWKFLP